MKVRRLSLAVALLSVSLTSLGQTSNGFVDGHTLHAQLTVFQQMLAGESKASPGEKMNAMGAAGYVVGVADIDNNAEFCLPKPITRGVVISVVTDFLNGHPDEWNQTAAVDVGIALKLAYPCKK